MNVRVTTKWSISGKKVNNQILNLYWRYFFCKMFKLGYDSSFDHEHWPNDLIGRFYIVEKFEICVCLKCILDPIMSLVIFCLCNFLPTNESMLSLPQMKIWMRFNAYNIFSFNLCALHTKFISNPNTSQSHKDFDYRRFIAGSTQVGQIIN